MDIIELKKELLENKLKNFYVFTGEELALQDIYINKISEISKLNIKRVDSVLDIYNLLTAKTLLKCTPNIYVIRNDDKYLSNTSIWDKLLLKDNFKGNILILLYTNQTTEFNKKHAEVITKFDFIGDRLLINRLIATTGLKDIYCEELVKICSCNYGRIKHEIYKLFMLCKINNYNINTAYIKARKCNFIHEDIGDIIFDFTNSIVDRNINLAYDLLPKIMKTDDGSSIKLLSVLYNSFRNILMVQTTPYKDRTEEVLGISKGQIYVTSQKCNKYTGIELVNILKTIRYLEKGIKIGIVEDKFAISYLLGEIW